VLYWDAGSAMYSRTARPFALSCTRFTALRVASKLACRPFLLKNTANRSLSRAASTSRVGCSIARGTARRARARARVVVARTGADASTRARPRVIVVVARIEPGERVASRRERTDGRTRCVEVVEIPPRRYRRARRYPSTTSVARAHRDAAKASNR